MSYTLPPLPYDFNALEPYIDAKTMEIHYTKHHQTYLDKFNKALEKYPELAGKPAEDIIKNINDLKIDEKDCLAIKNNGGGFINHNFFWQMMAPQKQIDGKLVDEINQSFGSIEDFKKQFTDAAVNRFGSGWVWLVRHNGGKLEICSTANQDSPLSLGHTPLIALDVWEHAYYLKYQNKRADYIEAWWNVLKLI